MATVTSSSDLAAQNSVLQSSSGSGSEPVFPGVQTAVRSGSTQLWLPVIAMIGLFFVAVAGHRALRDSLAGQTEGLLVEKLIQDKGFAFDSNVFTAVGLVFLVQAIGSHAWVVRRLRAASQPSRAASPMTLLAVPMALRLATTFAALAYLLITVTASRHEAVCMVLFWYIALTTLEVAAIVWAQRPIKQASLSHPSNTSS